MVDIAWEELTSELDRWQAAGQTAEFWWRDDDATADTAALQQLLTLQRVQGVPLALAVIGGVASQALADRVMAANADGQQVQILSHGYRHENHAHPGEKKSEFPNHRIAYDMLADISLGFEGLKVLFKNSALPVFVPPWNRFAPGMVPRLQNAQITGYSAFGPSSDLSDYGVTAANCQIDIVNWRGGRDFIGARQALAQICNELKERRETNREDAIGVLSHHLDHDDACWSFLAQLFQATNGHVAANWKNATDIFNVAS